MRKLLATLILAAAPAFAGTVATATNNSGGILVLTDVKCEGKNTLVAYTTSSMGNTLFGCWFLDDNFVLISWADGDIRSYPFGIWVMKKKNPTY